VAWAFEDPSCRPEPQIIAAFEKIAYPLDQAVEHNTLENVTLTSLRDMLLPKLMSGEIRLRQAEKAVEAAL